jgi:hypothetical protein
MERVPSYFVSRGEFILKGVNEVWMLFITHPNAQRDFISLQGGGM